MIIIGATLVQAIIAGGLGTLAWYIIGRHDGASAVRAVIFGLDDRVSWKGL